MTDIKEEQKKHAESLREFYEKTIHKTLMTTLCNTGNLPEDIKEKMSQELQKILEVDGAEWEVTIEGMKLMFMPANETAVDQFYTGDEAKDMKEYLRHWQELRKQTTP